MNLIPHKKTELMFLFTLLFLAGCRVISTVSQPIEPIPTGTTIPSGASSPSSIQPSPAGVFSATPTTSINPIRKEITATPPLPTPVQELSEKDHAAFLYSMLQPNQECMLPCWWGITPGRTSAADVAHYFELMSARIREGDNYLGVTFGTPDDIFSIGIRFRPVDGIIQSIYIESSVTMGNYQIHGHPVYSTYMHHYKLQSLLTTYGKPAKVMIHSNRYLSPGAWGGGSDYYIYLFYPNWGFFALYYGNREELHEKYRICPTYATVDLALYNPVYYRSKGLDRYETIVVRIFPADINGNYTLPLSEATGWNIDEFYQAFTSDRYACFDTPKSLWDKR